MSNSPVYDGTFDDNDLITEAKHDDNQNDNNKVNVDGEESQNGVSKPRVPENESQEFAFSIQFPPPTDYTATSPPHSASASSSSTLSAMHYESQSLGVDSQFMSIIQETSEVLKDEEPIITDATQSESQSGSQRLQPQSSSVSQPELEYSSTALKNVFELMSQSQHSQRRTSIEYKRRGNSKTPSKRKSGTIFSSPSIYDQGSRFAECPLCGKSILKIDIERHAANCNGLPAESQQAQSHPQSQSNYTTTPSTKKSNTMNAGSISLSKSSKGSKLLSKQLQGAKMEYEKCPICGVEVLTSLLQIHMGECLTSLNASQKSEPAIPSSLQNKQKQSNSTTTVVPNAGASATARVQSCTTIVAPSPINAKPPIRSSGAHGDAGLSSTIMDPSQSQSLESQIFETHTPTILVATSSSSQLPQHLQMSEDTASENVGEIEHRHVPFDDDNTYNESTVDLNKTSNSEIPMASLFTPPSSAEKAEQHSPHSSKEDKENQSPPKVHPLFTGGALKGDAFKKSTKRVADKRVIQHFAFIMDYDHQCDTTRHDVMVPTSSAKQSTAFIYTPSATSMTIQVYPYAYSYGWRWYWMQSHDSPFPERLDVSINAEESSCSCSTMSTDNAQQDSTPSSVLMSTYKQSATINVREPLLDDKGVTQLSIFATPDFDSISPKILDWYDSNFACNQPVKHRFALSPSLLKSALQKNVRMSRPIESVRSALELTIRFGFLELIRRITIIIVEDAFMHPLFPYLVWLNALASKSTPKFHPTYMHMNTVLQVVYEIAAVQYKDNLLPEDINPTQHPVPTLTTDINHLSAPQRSIVWSLLIRASFGGMAGDVDMLRKYALLWLMRFTHDNEKEAPQKAGEEHGDNAGSSAHHPSPSTETSKKVHKSWLNLIYAMYTRARDNRLLEVQDVTPLEQDDILLTAVDHHCSDLLKILMYSGSKTRVMIDRFMRDNFPGSNEEKVTSLLASMIWNNRSALTTKKNIRLVNEASDATKLKLQQLHHNVSKHHVLLPSLLVSTLLKYP